MCAFSELAWRLANRAAIPCAMTASYLANQVSGSERLKCERAYAEEHPTPREDHLYDGIRLRC